MAGRFWRFIVTDLDTITLSFLDRVASDRRVAYALNDESVHEGRVPSDSRNLSRIANDGDPVLAMNSRLIYGFRREVDGVPDSTTPSLWVPRFSGIVQIVGDTAQADEPVTHYTAYDPWHLLQTRPMLTDSGLLPTDGRTFRETAGSAIAVDLLTNSDVFHGTCRIDYGQTGFYTGTIETTDEISRHFEAGTTVGEAWKILTDSGTLDIVLEPIYDPVNRPGFCSQLNIYATAGEDKQSAVFAWDKPGRSLVGIDRTQDGTLMANKVLFYTGNGKPAALQTNAASVAKYGQYWLERSISDEFQTGAVQLLARAELRLRRLGKTTLSIDPAPERSPEPFTDYFCGDRVPIFASSRLRLPISLENPEDEPRRVYAIPITIGDDGTENVEQLLLSSPFDE